MIQDKTTQKSHPLQTIQQGKWEMRRSLQNHLVLKGEKMLVAWNINDTKIGRRKETT